jgi:pimeloyl-ACP methyl ester carboxylesterase
MYRPRPLLTGTPPGDRPRFARGFAAFVAVMAMAVSSCAGHTGGSAGETGEPAGRPTTSTTEARPGDDPSGEAEATGDAETPEEPTSPPPVRFERLDHVTTAREYPSGEGLSHWETTLPGAQHVEITSSADGTTQPAFWLPPRGGGPRPLLVILHSWSFGFSAWGNVPLAQWAEREGWAAISPHFRGASGQPDGTGSDLAVSDVIDSIDFAVARGGVDPGRVFTIGYSGGGMMSLLVAGRHPDRLAGAVAWAPVVDLVDWHHFTTDWNDRYAREIRRACGGNPERDPAARQSCEHRSPLAHLPATREAALPVYLGHGVRDVVVPTDHSLRAFERLLDPAQPPEDAPHHFGPGDPAVVSSNRSGSATLVLFDGRHDMVYNPGLEWIAHVAARTTPEPARQ